MIKLLRTEPFRSWLDALRDKAGQGRIQARLSRLKEEGHFGDCGSVGEGVFEMRIDHGPGYRLYYIRDGATVIMLLVGGDKSSQSRDIRKAKGMAKLLRADDE